MISAADLPVNDPRRIVQQLTEDDNRVIEALHNLGMFRTAPAVLLAMVRFGMGVEVTSRWLEKVTDLRQPEVSLGLKYLMDRGLVIEQENTRKFNKGRPWKHYVLARPPMDFVRELIEQKQQAIRDDARLLYALWPGMSA